MNETRVVEDISVVMQFCIASMSAMLAITKHGMCMGIITPCLINFTMADMEAVQNCLSARHIEVDGT